VVNCRGGLDSRRVGLRPTLRQRPTPGIPAIPRSPHGRGPPSRSRMRPTITSTSPSRPQPMPAPALSARRCRKRTTRLLSGWPIARLGRWSSSAATRRLSVTKRARARRSATIGPSEPGRDPRHRPCPHHRGDDSPGLRATRSLERRPAPPTIQLGRTSTTAVGVRGSDSSRRLGGAAAVRRRNDTDRRPLLAPGVAPNLGRVTPWMRPENKHVFNPTTATPPRAREAGR
jgi:hypothetical protein